METDGNSVFITLDGNGVRIVNVTNPAAPSITGTYSQGFSWGLDLQGDYLFVAKGTSGIDVVDVSNPSSPYQWGYRDTNDYTWDCAVNGDYLIACDDAGGAVLMDISDESWPIIKSTYPTGGYSNGIFLSDDLAAIANGKAGVKFLDISNPLVPTEVSFFDPAGGDGYNVFIDGTTAYLAYGMGGVYILDITNPSSPSFVTNLSHSRGDSRRKVFKNDEVLVVANGIYGVGIWDITGSSPVLIETIDTGGTAIDVSLERINGTWILFVVNSNGLTKIYNAYSFIEMQEIDFHDDSNGVFLRVLPNSKAESVHIFVTSFNSGIYIYEFSMAAEISPPVISIQATSEEIFIYWEAVTGAVSYKIYQSDNPYASDWGEPVAITEQTSYSGTNGSKRFYKVTSSDEPAD